MHTCNPSMHYSIVVTLLEAVQLRPQLQYSDTGTKGTLLKTGSMLNHTRENEFLRSSVIPPLFTPSLPLIIPDGLCGRRTDLCHLVQLFDELDLR